MAVSYLFYLGVLIPSLVTIVLFAVFLWCLWKYRVRRRIMTKMYAPHAKGWPTPKEKISPYENVYDLKDNMRVMFDSRTTKLEIGAPLDNTFQTRELSERRQDSGISDISDNHQHQRSQMCTGVKRPYSQASTDSDDSGFRSSRSNHLLHKYESRDLSPYQDVPLLRGLNSIPQSADSDRSTPSSLYRENPGCEYLQQTKQNFNVHLTYPQPYFGGHISQLPETELNAIPSCSGYHHSASQNFYSQQNVRTDSPVSSISSDLRIVPNGLYSPNVHTVTTAMIHLSPDRNDMPIYSVV